MLLVDDHTVTGHPEVIMRFDANADIDDVYRFGRPIAEQRGHQLSIYLSFDPSEKREDKFMGYIEPQTRRKPKAVKVPPQTPGFYVGWGRGSAKTS